MGPLPLTGSPHAMHSSPRRLGALLALGLAVPLAAPLIAQGPPGGYYDPVDDSNPAALRQTLHAVIDDHQRFPYTSGSTDTWDILELAMEDPSDSTRIVELYKNASLAKQGGGNSFYNREHTWPNSYGFPDNGSGNYPYTDCHLLFLCDIGYNSNRGNKPFRTCNAGCSERPTISGGSGTYPGNSNWMSGSAVQGTWETWMGRRGDVARGLLYADVRYEGGTHGVTGFSEPDLVLTDVEALIASTQTGNNESLAYMGMLAVLLTWHVEDPVDARERAKNDVVFAFQGNRNPFVDHPEWVACLFESDCGVGAPYCFGTACPCGNGDAGAGCANSTGSGALLAAQSGSLSFSHDDLVLELSGMPANQFGIVFMGGSTAGSVFGDGRLCVGTVHGRFPVRAADAGGSLLEGPGIVAFTFAGFPPAGWITVGVPYFFQGWYRDPGGPCGQFFNLSNGLELLFTP